MELEKLAYCYWEFLPIIKVIALLKEKEYVTDKEYILNILLKVKNRLGLDESVEQLIDKKYQDKIIRE